MPLAIPLTEEMVQHLAPNEDVFRRAGEIVGEKRIINPGVSADGSWLLGEAKGKARKNYSISVDFIDVNNPVFRSNSPSRQIPDKYSLALLLAYAREPQRFVHREPSEDLLAKREKKQAQDAKKAGVFPSAKKIVKSLAEKKTAAQREGLEQIEMLLVDLAASGHWQNELGLEKIEKQLKLLSDNQLPLPVFLLRRLLLLGKNKTVSEAEQAEAALEIFGHLWYAAQAGLALLDGQAVNESFAGESLLAEDAILGRNWQISDLKDKGFAQNNLTLLELAYERTDDEGRAQRLETSNLMNLNSGEILQSIAYRPFKGISQLPEQPSYTSPITVPEAVVYPGMGNFRVRWDKGAEQAVEVPRSLERALAHSSSGWTPIVESFREQLKHALAPRELVCLVRCKKIGKLGNRCVAEDAAGVRVELIDRSKDAGNVANLLRGMGMLGKDHPALLVRLFVQVHGNVITGVPLSLLTDKHLLRLGL